MRNFTFFCLFFLFHGALFSQNVAIQWNGTETFDFGTYKMVLPKFSNSGYRFEENSIYLNLKQPASGKKVKITNLQWQKIAAKELYDLPLEPLPKTENSSISYYNDLATNTPVYNARISVFKKENGIIFRLNAFEILEDAESITARSTAIPSKIGTTENPLKNGTFYKIKVDKSGIFKITKKFLADNGISTNNINPKNFRIYGNGGLSLPEYNADSRYAALQENAIQVVGEEDGVWNDTDYALFYAQGPNGFNVYKNGLGTQNKRSETRSDASLHFQNIYEDYAYYFINFDIGAGKRVQTDDVALPSSLITRYDDYQYLDEEKNNLLKLGRVWVGDGFTSERKITFNTKSPILPGDIVYYRASAVGFKSLKNTVKFNINGTNEYTATLNNNTVDYEKIYGFTGSVSGLSGNALTITVTSDISQNPNGAFYLDYAEVAYKQDLVYNDAQMNFRSYDILEGSGSAYGFSVANAGNVEQIWEVSDITNAKKKTNKAGSSGTFNFGYTADSNLFTNEFVAFKNTAAYSPSFVGKIEKQDLASIQNIDYLIITRKDLMGNAQRLADYHEQKNNYHTAVVDIEQIYNEYSSGSKDITAVRDFVSSLKNEKGGLKYLLLIGDTSYDFRGRYSNTDNIIPSYQSTESGNFVNSFVTDDYFVMTDAQNSPNIYNKMPTLPVGRLVASNNAEAKTLVDKTLAYYNALPGQSSPFGEWRLKLDFVVDNDADNGTPFHKIIENTIKNNFEGTERREYNIRKLYLASFPSEATAGGLRIPQINQAISNDVGNSLYLFYFGHGGINGWAQERVLTTDMIQNFNNFTSVYSRFPLVSTITCEFTLWDNPEVNSAGEQVIKLKTGGAATMITSSRAIAVSYGENFSKLFTSEIFKLTNNNFKNLGDAHLLAKYAYGNDANHLKVNFLGDPAMKLSRPQQYIKIDQIDSPVAGQIRALDFVKVSGSVVKADGTSVDTGYNGKMVINIFDKLLNKTTLSGDLSYKEEGSPIVKTAAKVVNGKFSAEFYVPKDINYTVGEGRLLVYADNFETAGRNAYDVFQSQPQQIGGINPDGINDNTAPKVNLFLNNTNFADGGITNQNPMLLACVTDDTGINATGAGIGHDITVILDGEIINTTVLNDFFAAGEGNGCVNASLKEYQKGTVTYPFRNLKPGNHQLTFKVWDINNNSTTATLNFVVKDEAEQKLILNKLLNWPNPFTDKTYIQFEHNCDDILDVNVQIYTITGKLVRTLSVPVNSVPFLQGYRTPVQAIEWDGKDDFGDAVGKGTYIYKVFAKSQNQDKCKGGATAVEKMVILK